MYPIEKEALKVIETVLIDTEIPINTRLNAAFKIFSPCKMQPIAIIALDVIETILIDPEVSNNVRLDIVFKLLEPN